MARYTMTVTLKTTAEWATSEELQRRFDLETSLGKALRRNGFVDGGDSGLGTMTIFICDVKDPHKARERVNAVLEQNGLAAEASLEHWADEG
jgi:hypothetical protein